MKIAVIAAYGRSGQAFVKMALAAGHTVRAGVRNRNHLMPHQNLTVITCDATNEVQLKELCAGQEAVASFIGHVRGSAPNVQTLAMQNTVKVMEQLGITRIVSLTGTGVRYPGDKVTFIDKILNLSISLIDSDRVNDGKNHVEVLEQSDLDWTIIRVLKLQNSKLQPFKLLVHGPTKIVVGREEVAQAVLQVLEQQSFIKQAPIIGKP